MLTYKIKDLNNNEKPRERLLNLGASALSNSELLALLLQTGGRNESVLELSRGLLIKFGGLSGVLEASVAQLTSQKNVGQAKAVIIKAAGELALRINFLNDVKTKAVSTPKDIYKFLKKDFYGKKKEVLYAISLDSRNKIIGKDIVSVGTVNETVVSPREIYRQALLRNAVSIILVHNHPSQDTAPSTEDILVTEKVAQAGVMMGIALVDHVIVCDSEFSSLKALNLFKTRKFNGEEVKK